MQVRWVAVLGAMFLSACGGLEDVDFADLEAGAGQLRLAAKDVGALRVPVSGGGYQLRLTGIRESGANAARSGCKVAVDGCYAVNRDGTIGLGNLCSGRWALHGALYDADAPSCGNGSVVAAVAACAANTVLSTGHDPVALSCSPAEAAVIFDVRLQ